MAWRGVSMLPVLKRKIFNLVRAFDAPNRTKEMPAPVEINHGWILDRVTGIIASLGCGNDRRAKGPMKFTRINPICSSCSQRTTNGKKHDQSDHARDNRNRPPRWKLQIDPNAAPCSFELRVATAQFLKEDGARCRCRTCRSEERRVGKEWKYWCA